MSTLRIPAERAEIHATVRMQSGIYPPLRLVTPIAEATKACLNCDEPLVGKFCHQCGQTAKAKRFTFGAFLHELPHEILHLDHALPHTLKSLLTKPAPTIRDYLAGRRAKIYSPLALLFTLNGLVALAMITLKLDGATRLAKSGASDVAIGSETSGSAKAVMLFGESLMARLPELITHYRAWLQLILLPVIALAPYLVLRKRTGFGFGEQVIVMTMIGIGDAVISLGMAPIHWLTRNHPALHSVSGTIDGIVTLAYMLWALAELQNDGRRDGLARWLRSGATCLASYVITGAGMLLFMMALLVPVFECAAVAYWRGHH